MVNINCTYACAYQKEGKCHLEAIPPGCHSNGLCAYFMPLDEGKNERNEVLSHGTSNQETQ